MTLSPTTRASLLLRLRDPKDHQAWLEFVTLYEPVTYRIFRRHGLQDADAWEVTQDLFMAVSRSIDRWDPAKERGSFRGWLRCVAHNLVVNWLNRRHLQLIPAGGSDLQSLLDRLPDVSGPETVELDQELRRAVFQRAAEQVRAVVQPATWQAFWETALVGSAAAAAAQKLGMTVGAVRVAKCRILARLQAAVKEMETTT